MKKIIIQGARPLKGELTINGAKNCVVALIPAAIMADSPVTIEGVPEIRDVYTLVRILEDFNVKVSFENNTMVIDPTDMENIPMPNGAITEMRASYYFMGALLSKYGEGVVGLPGGCDLGPRPIDQHVKAFEALGATVRNEVGAIYLTTPEEGLQGTHIYMDNVSVGATINALLASVKAEGQTVIENAAREPEIVDVVNLLNKMGADIHGAGTSTIKINGVKELHGTTHTAIPDRIEAGTYLIAAAAIGEGVTIKNVIYEHLESLLSKMKEMGIELDVGSDSIYVHPRPEKMKMVDIKTMPYPGFATDLQQPMTPLLLLAEGVGTIRDTIYPKRINHVPELNRMGAKIKAEDGLIVAEGPNKFVGAEVHATDLRAGACLVLAGLIAEGETVITGVTNILRGYDRIIEKLTNLGADIRLVEE